MTFLLQGASEALLDPGAEERRRMTRAVTSWSEEFLEELPRRKAYVKTERNGLGVTELGIRESPREIEQVLGLQQAIKISSSKNK